MKTTVTLLILLLLLNPAKTKNIQKPSPLKPITLVLKHQNDTVVHFKKGMNKISKPIFDFRLDDY